MDTAFIRRSRIVVIFAAISLFRTAGAATLLVSNTNDTGAGSLRQAIADNTTLGGSNTIVFSNVVTGTITLTNGQLFINKDVKIIGPGPAVLSVDGHAAGRVFATGPGTTVTIAGLTITNGSFAGGSGGGIYNQQSTLTLSNCVVRGNTARNGGGIYNDHGSGSASLTVNACTVSGNTASYGGGIYNSAISFGSAGMSVIASTLSGNSASYGGGIYNDARSSGTAPVAVTASTFNSNSAAIDPDIGGGVGGAIYNDGENGGNGTITITTSTFSGNSAQDGGALNANGYQGTARFYVSDSTFSSNSANSGGAISSYGFQGAAQVFVNASTLCGNTSSGGFGAIYNDNATLRLGDTILKAGLSTSNIFNTSGSVISDGYNLSSDNGSGFLTGTNDQLNTDPLLGPLQDNGGPTFTHALLTGSPAVDHGKADAISFLPVTTDQRGFSRPFDFSSVTNTPGGDASDIGAFELAILRLNIQQAGSNVVLSWPSYFNNFTLQSSTNFALSNSWVTVAGSAVLLGNQYQQTNGPISGKQFFRLRGN